MATGFGTPVVEAQAETTSASTLSFTGLTFPVGTFLCVLVASNTSASPSISDDASNKWQGWTSPTQQVVAGTVSLRTWVGNTISSASGTACLLSSYTVLTTALAGQDITVDIGSSTSIAGILVSLTGTILNYSQIDDYSSSRGAGGAFGDNTGTNADPSISEGTPRFYGDMVFGAITTLGTGITRTEASGWNTLVNQYGNANVALSAAWRINDSPDLTPLVYNPTLSASPGRWTGHVRGFIDPTFQLLTGGRAM